ncbi:antitoxin VbhA family protein [Dyella sp. SG609]|uniref:antitoxin VbhA family protein n=1 Tax=Dyella sp. SG609 TaxID=2587018 RepID=UPI00182D27B4|nr:antitoxin VbhA family protein [Dyella sp. SG609]NKJ21959.1 hypothetical protein [Dyella sp. SG609]
MTRKHIIVEASEREDSRARFIAAMRGEAVGQYVTVHGNAGISVAERQRRQEAVDYALATVGLEGFSPSDAVQELARRYVNGEISMVELMGDSAANSGS